MGAFAQISNTILSVWEKIGTMFSDIWGGFKLFLKQGWAIVLVVITFVYTAMTSMVSMVQATIAQIATVLNAVWSAGDGVTGSINTGGPGNLFVTAWNLGNTFLPLSELVGYVGLYYALDLALLVIGLTHKAYHMIRG